MSPPEDDGGASNGGGEIACELVIACGDPSKILEAIEHPFDEIALLVEIQIDRPLVFSGRMGRNRSGNAAERQILTKLPRVVAGVADQAALGGQLRGQVIGSGDVGPVARRQEETEEPPLAVADGVDLGRPAAPRATTACAVAPFPPAAARWIRIDVLSIDRSSFGMACTRPWKIAIQRPRRLHRLKRL